MTNLSLEADWLWEFDGNEWGFDPRLPRVHELEQFDIPEATQTQIVNDHYWKCVRVVRDRLIAETDWWASSDLTMSTERAAYRQALRDITTQPDPQNIVWPEKPA